MTKEKAEEKKEKKSLGELLECPSLNDIPIPNTIAESTLLEAKKHLINGGQDITFEDVHKESSRIRYKEDVALLKTLGFQ